MTMQEEYEKLAALDEDDDETAEAIEAEAEQPQSFIMDQIEAMVDESVRHYAIKITTAILSLLKGPQDEHYQAVQALISTGSDKRREMTEPEQVWRRLWGKYGDSEAFNPCQPQSAAVKCAKIGKLELLALLQKWEAQGGVVVDRERGEWRLVNKNKVAG